MLTALPSDKIIRANGDYAIRKDLGPGQRVIVELDGVLGGATVTIGRLKRVPNPDAGEEGASSHIYEFAPYLKPESTDPLTSADADMWDLAVANRGTICARVSGVTGDEESTTTAIELTVTKVSAGNNF